MKRTLTWFVLAVTLAAADRQTLTQEQMQVSYDASVAYVRAHLQTASTATFAPIQDAKFKVGRMISVTITVDAQNNYGAMIRGRFVCLGGWAKDGQYRVRTCLD